MVYLNIPALARGRSDFGELSPSLSPRAEGSRIAPDRPQSKYDAFASRSCGRPIIGFTLRYTAIRNRKWTIIAIISFVLLAALAAERLWTGLAWDLTFRAGMSYAPDVAHQYATYHAAHGKWPAQNELITRLEFLDSQTRSDRRVDRYACGPYAGYVLAVHLRNDGKAEYYCWSR